MAQIELTEKAVKEYLDKAIRAWREQKGKAKKNSEGELVASCYIDAFQCVKISLFGGLLGE